MPGLSCRDAIKAWEQKTGLIPNETLEVNLMCELPNPIDRLDESLNMFEQCEKLSFSTNEIVKLVPMPKLANLKILSLGRNKLRSLKFIDDVSATLEQLWVSYNQLDRLDHLANMQKLRKASKEVVAPNAKARALVSDVIVIAGPECLIASPIRSAVGFEISV